jgi:hypothetical protein
LQQDRVPVRLDHLFLIVPARRLSGQIARPAHPLIVLSGQGQLLIEGTLQLVLSVRARMATSLRQPGLRKTGQCKTGQ